MLRLVLSIFLTLAMTVASAASIAETHDISTASDHATGETPHSHAHDHVDCCDEAGNLGFGNCAGELVAVATEIDDLSSFSHRVNAPDVEKHLQSLSLSVPTGPPKV